ncbi:MAG: hypothetical protein PHW79_05285 [Candidatus Marinimicrobia bacterium]|nr:hypothetical protein [Candidatus Neomarinimicrobiota bacterium]
MKKTSLLLRFFCSCFLVISAFFLNIEFGFSQTSTETVLFSSTAVSQWTIDGRVTIQSSDTTLRFLFGFDEDNPPKVRPDTTTLEIVSEIDISGCDSAFFRYTAYDFLPNNESWIVGTVNVYVRHENQPQWTEVFEDLTAVAGSVHHLKVQVKVAVRSDEITPGSFAIDNIRIVGKNY